MAGTSGHIVIGEKVSPPTTRALSRPRVTERLDQLADCGVGYVHGAAGIGKTTVLGQMSQGWDGPVAWIRLDHGDASEDRLVALLAAALGLPVESSEAPLDHLIAAIETTTSASTLLVVDDLHSIDGSEAADAIDRILRYRPRNLTVLMASRHELDPVRRGQIGAVEPMVFDFEDLRFRVWEVDGLMREHLEVAIAPADLSLLTRYTDGWAAALRLFSVACRDAAPEQRRQLISGLRTSAGMVHDYLMTEVLSSLDTGDRSFLLRTSVFEQLTPSRAEQLLGVEDATATLRRVQTVGLFNVTTGASSYACHDLLRSHLLSRLPEEIGAEAATALQLRAAAIAEAENAPAEAIRYYARGGDTDAVRRILDASGAELSAAPGRWIEVLPPAMREQDPFVLLTSARHLVRHGDLREARARYRRAVDLLDTEHGARRYAHLELRRVDAWLENPIAPVTDWVGAVRHVLGAGTPDARRPVEDPFGIAGAVAAVFRGDLASSANDFASAADRADGLTGIVCGALGLVIDLLRHGPDGCSPAAIRRVQHAAKHADARAVERIVGAIARGGVGAGPGDPLVEECRNAGDTLGGGLVLLIDGIALIHKGQPDRAPFAAAAHQFDEGNHEAAAFLARCFAAAVARGDEVEQLRELEAPARRRGGMAQLLVVLAGSTRTDAPKGLHEEVDRMARRMDLVTLVARLRRRPRSGAQARARAVNVLGHLALEIADEPVVAELTPLHREVFALLALHPGDWISRDRLMGAFWPDKDEQRAARSLQVAISKIRGELDRLGLGSLEHDCGRYRYAPGDGVEVDIELLRSRLERLSRRATDLEERAIEAEDLLRSYRDPVEDLGAVDWATDPRRRLRREVARLALDVARELHDNDERPWSARLAELGVEIDPGSDDLWQLAIASAGAARARELRAAYDRYVDA